MIEEERKEAERERIREERAEANAVVPEVSVNADVAPSQVVPEQPVPVTSAPVGFESPVLQPSEKTCLALYCVTECRLWNSKVILHIMKRRALFRLRISYVTHSMDMSSQTPHIDGFMTSTSDFTTRTRH